MQLNYILYFRSYLDKLKQICISQEEAIQKEVIHSFIHSFIHSIYSKCNMYVIYDVLN